MYFNFLRIYGLFSHLGMFSLVIISHHRLDLPNVCWLPTLVFLVKTEIMFELEAIGWLAILTLWVSVLSGYLVDAIQVLYSLALYSCCFVNHFWHVNNMKNSSAKVSICTTAKGVNGPGPGFFLSKLNWTGPEQTNVESEVGYSVVHIIYFRACLKHVFNLNPTKVVVLFFVWISSQDQDKVEKWKRVWKCLLHFSLACIPISGLRLVLQWDSDELSTTSNESECWNLYFPVLGL